MLLHMKTPTRLLLYFILFVGLSFAVYAEEREMGANNTELSFYSGMFDFSDNGKRAVLFGIQHQNEELFRESFLGILSPVTGGMITADNAIYIYSGVQAEYDIGALKFTPSFTPGLYNEGDGKDLGHPFNSSQNTMLGMSYNHISNASLGDNNPGANSYSFNFLKKF